MGSFKSDHNKRRDMIKLITLRSFVNVPDYRCVPRWSVMRGFRFKSSIESSVRMPLSELENYSVDENDVDDRNYMATPTATMSTSTEFCARFKLINC